MNKIIGTVLAVILIWWIEEGRRKYYAKKIIKEYKKTHNDEIAYIMANRILKDQL